MSSIPSSKFLKLQQMINTHSNYSSISLQLDPSSSSLITNSIPFKQINPKTNINLINNINTNTNTKHNAKTNIEKISEDKENMVRSLSTIIKRKEGHVPMIRIGKEKREGGRLGANSERMIQSVIVEGEIEYEMEGEEGQEERVANGMCQTIREENRRDKKVVIRELFKKKTEVPNTQLQTHIQTKKPAQNQIITKPKTQTIPHHSTLKQFSSINHHLFTIKRNTPNQPDPHAHAHPQLKSPSNALRLSGINKTIQKLHQTIQQRKIQIAPHPPSDPANNFWPSFLPFKEQYEEQSQSVKESDNDEEESMFGFELFPEIERGVNNGNIGVELSLSFGFGLGKENWANKEKRQEQHKKEGQDFQIPK